MAVAVLVLVLGGFVLAVLGCALRIAYAWGWNDCVIHHAKRDPMDPTWTTFV